MDIAEKPPSPPWLLWSSVTRPSRAILLVSLSLLFFTWLQTATRTTTTTPLPPPLPSPTGVGSVVPVAGPPSCSGFYRPPAGLAGERRRVFSILEFGGVGDGRTPNTGAFRAAVARAEALAGEGGAQLNVPRGRWLTGSFNLTSNFTLFLEEGAVILGSQDPKDWPVIKALPSYGRGRERPGGRHISLLHAQGVSNLVITGQNGTIDGQGRMWWEMWWNRTLQHTRGHLLELVDSRNVLVTNLTFLNSPFWTIHPVYCSNVVIKGVTVLAPPNAPNTDGIDPDSSTHVCIEDCYIESGDDLVAIKSGWDHYGAAVAKPSSHIIIRRLSGTTPTCSGVGIGSEMSGGVSDVLVEDLRVWDSAAGVRLKTDRGRGGYVRNVTVAGVSLERVRVPFRFSRGADDHPDDGWDRAAMPRVERVVIRDVVGVGVGRAPVMDGIEGAAFDGICLRNISFTGLAPAAAEWQCEFVAGSSFDVFPEPCPQLRRNDSWCRQL